MPADTLLVPTLGISDHAPTLLGDGAPPTPKDLIDAAKAALAAGDAAGALTLAQDARLRFPQHSFVLHELARMFERLSDWDQAEACWRNVIELGSPKWWAYTGLAAALRQQRKHSDASFVLRAGIDAHPNEPELYAEFAKGLGAMGDHEAELRAWNQVVAKFPARWIGFRGKVSALSRSGESATADALILEHASRFPADLDAMHDLARLFERRGAWNKAAPLWEAVVKLNQRDVWPCLALARAYRMQGLFVAASDCLAGSLDRFPKNAELLMEAARCAEAADRHADALRYWQDVAEVPGSGMDPVLGQVRATRRLGDRAGADKIALGLAVRFPDEPIVLEQHALNAIFSEDWPEAMKRLQNAQRRFPSYDGFRKRMTEVRAKLLEAGLDIPGEGAEDESARRDRELVGQFESLGGRGHGCEFGIFQRHYGAEPLGLLRWADLGPEQVTGLLKTEFAGVGEPEYTNLFVPAGGTNPEYWTTDTRYHMAMRSFVLVADVPMERMRRQVTRRMNFLSRKLVEDLRAGEKIFVYKNMKENLTEAQLEALYEACHSYGDNVLLYIAYQDEAHPHGTVVWQRDGLLVGYIERFSHTADTDAYLGSANDLLMTVCRNAYALWHKSDEAGCLPPARHATLADFKGALRDGSFAVARSMVPAVMSGYVREQDSLVATIATLFDRAEFDWADRMLSDILRQAPELYAAAEAFATSAVHRRDWAEAVARWQRVRIAFPQEPKPALGLAEALQAMQRFPEAEEVLRFAVVQFPDNAEISEAHAKSLVPSA